MTGAGMVVVGVSSDLEILGANRADRYADEIKIAVEKERSELVVVGTDSLRKKMESVNYASFARIQETSTRVRNTENPIYENKDDKKN